MLARQLKGLGRWVQGTTCCVTVPDINVGALIIVFVTSHCRKLGRLPLLMKMPLSNELFARPSARTISLTRGSSHSYPGETASATSSSSRTDDKLSQAVHVCVLTRRERSFVLTSMGVSVYPAPGQILSQPRTSALSGESHACDSFSSCWA